MQSRVNWGGNALEVLSANGRARMLARVAADQNFEILPVEKGGDQNSSAPGAHHALCDGWILEGCYVLRGRLFPNSSKRKGERVV
jgi:hypothetical protein